jgi:hypothetical protein
MHTLNAERSHTSKTLQNAQVRMLGHVASKLIPTRPAPSDILTPVGARADARGYGKTVAFLCSHEVAK